MSEASNSQPIEAGLAHVLWRRYTITPSTIQRQAILRPIQSIATRGLERTPLLTNVQRRWLRSESTTDQGNSLKLPFVVSANPASGAREDAFTMQRKTFSLQDNHPQDGVVQVEGPERRMIVQAAMIPTESSERVQSTDPTGNHGLEDPRMQHYSSVSTQTVQRKPLAVKADQPLALPNTADFSDTKEIVLPEIKSIEEKSSALDASATSNDRLGIHLLHRYLGMPMVRAIQRKTPVAPEDTLQSALGETDLPTGELQVRAAIRSNERADISRSLIQAGGHFPSVPFWQRQRDTSLISDASRHSAVASMPNLFTTRLDTAIQRSVSFASHSHIIPPQLPLVKPLQISVQASQPDGFIQLSRNSINFPNDHPLPLTYLIQRQSQSSERPATEASGDVPAVTPPPTGSGPVGAVDIERIADQVMRIIVRQMTVERERRGIGR